MKKKFLSLMMAAAVVATTSVSAFAASNLDTTVDIPEDEGKKVNVKITGNVEDRNGDVLPGTVSVTVPTAAVFNVNATSGNVNSGKMTITNHSDEKVLVFASDFTDTTGTSQIELKKDGVTKDSQRGHVALKLTGGKRTILFTSEKENGKSGKIYDVSTDAALLETDEIGEVTKESPLVLKLEGVGGTNGENNTPMKDDFQLVFKIKRAEN